MFGGLSKNESSSGKKKEEEYDEKFHDLLETRLEEERSLLRADMESQIYQERSERLKLESEMEELKRLISVRYPNETDTTKRSLGEKESFVDDINVDLSFNDKMNMESTEKKVDDSKSFHIKTRGISDTMMGFTSHNEDTYTLMMLAKGICDKSWVLGFLVFASQVFLCGLTIYSQLNDAGNKFSNKTPLDIPIQTKREVTVLQFFAIFIAVYSQDDMFNAIALPIDLRLSGPHPWGGIPVEEEEKESKSTWTKRILIPSLMKFIAGMLVLATSVIVILQSNEVIDLLMNFTALFVISSIDDVIYSVVRRGFFGTHLQLNAKTVEAIDIDSEEIVEDSSDKPTFINAHSIKAFTLNLFLALCVSVWVLVLYLQQTGWMANVKYPECVNKVPEFTTIWPLLDNDKCDLIFNFIECGFDGDDCKAFNAVYPGCIVEDTSRIADGKCDGFPYNSEECKLDGGDCRKEAIYCDALMSGNIGDGICDEMLNTHECRFDGGDCIAASKKCTFSLSDFFEEGIGLDAQLITPGDGICGVNLQMFNATEFDDDDSFFFQMSMSFFQEIEQNVTFRIYDGNYECAFDGGDCLHPRFHGCYFNESFPLFLEEIGNGVCQNYEPYNTEECGWDGGDCFDFNEKYPACEGKNPEKIGDGKCDEEYNIFACGYDKGDCCPKSNGICDIFSNNEECLWDNGDCLEFREKYPNCLVGHPFSYPEDIGNGRCQNYAFLNTEECGWDGGDCLEFNEKYPNCTVYYPTSIGNGQCDGGYYNTEECGWDRGDCLIPEYPECYVNNPEKIGDDSCDGGYYNTEECGWDGGDCLEFNELYPNCTVFHPSLIGDNICNRRDYNIEECGWDGGDCIEFNELYPNCTVYLPSYVGNNNCDGGFYNTEECRFDGGDCLDLNEKYPDCTDLSSSLGDGDCDASFNNEECAWDGGDCLELNESLLWDLYPNCTNVYPPYVGNTQCSRDTEYNRRECGWDGGDCASKEFICMQDPGVIWKNGNCTSVMEKYPNCAVDDIARVGNGICDGGDYNSEECGLDGGDCDYSNGFICLQEELLTWDESNATATAMNAHLAAFDCMEQNLRGVQLANLTNAWIGLTDKGHEDKWTYANGNGNITFTDWDEGQPNDYGIEDCGVIWFEGFQNGKWYDIPCSWNNAALYYSETPISNMTCMSFPKCPSI